MPAARLSALDASFLEIESPTAHMHVGWISTFLPPADGVRPTFAQLRDHVADRLGRAPRYRQRLAPVPLGLAVPRWADDDAFDVEHHVLHARRRATSRRSRTWRCRCRCPRERPLWELWIADELADGRSASSARRTTAGRRHRGGGAGVTAARPGSRRHRRPCPSAGAPRRRPGGWGCWPTRPWACRAQQKVLGAPARLAASPRRLLGFAGEARRVASTVVDTVEPAPTVPLINESISPLRRLALLERPLDDLVRIKRHFESTLNDVLLAVCAGGVRDLFEARGEPAEPLKTMVPSERARQRRGGRAGQPESSFMFVDLPCDEADPVMRPAARQRATRARKQAGQPGVAGAALRALEYAPRPVQQVVAHAAASPRAYNLVISNIPGPTEPLYMRGCRLEAAIR